MEVPGDKVRWEVVVRPRIDEAWYCGGESFCRVPVQTRSYYREQYGMQGMRPRRFREITVGVLEGAKLHPREQWELKDTLMRQPWRFPQVSILEEFDEWFAQAWYRQTGQLTWRGERIHE